MIQPEHLLPSNATPLERALSQTTDSLAHLGVLSDHLRDFKTQPGDALLPWLIWEYGLSELLPYLPDPRLAIRDGIRWQRLRGTPAALSTALAWVGMSATVEQEPPGTHFSEFQLDPGQVLDTNQAIANLVAIARLSAPARSRLSRLVHGYDLRRMLLDDSRLGESLLSDNSGVLWMDGKTQLSFGRVRNFALPPHSATTQTAREAVRFAVARLIDRYLLDFSVLGDPGHTPNEDILHSHLFTLANAWGVQIPQTVLPERRFCRAMVVLSDSTALGDSNACTPRWFRKEHGQALSLGGGDGLSNTPHRLIRVEVLERIEAVYPANLTVQAFTLKPHRRSTRAHRVMARADQTLGTLILGETTPSFDRGFLHRLSTHRNAPLPDAAGWRARLYQKAQLVLSESMLGEVNARTPRRALIRLRPVPKLGDWQLGEPGEVEWRALTEMQLRISSQRNAPYDFALETLGQHRLLTAATGFNLIPPVNHAHSPLLTASHHWQGQSWTGVRWPQSSWQDTRELIGACHFSQT